LLGEHQQGDGREVHGAIQHPEREQHRKRRRLHPDKGHGIDDQRGGDPALDVGRLAGQHANGTVSIPASMFTVMKACASVVDPPCTTTTSSWSPGTRRVTGTRVKNMARAIVAWARITG
jgi:hypothetical protein